MSDGVSFRRIHGRIVPIRGKGQQPSKIKAKEVAKGLAIAGAGLAIGVAGGRAYKNAVVNSVKYSFKSTGIIDAYLRKHPRGTQFSFEHLAHKENVFKHAEKQMKIAVMHERVAKVLRVVTPLSSGFAVDRGLRRTTNALKKKDSKIPEYTAGAIAGSFLVGMHGKEGLKHIYNKTAVQVLARLSKIKLNGAF